MPSPPTTQPCMDVPMEVELSESDLMKLPIIELQWRLAVANVTIPQGIAQKSDLVAALQKACQGGAVGVSGAKASTASPKLSTMRPTEAAQVGFQQSTHACLRREMPVSEKPLSTMRPTEAAQVGFQQSTHSCLRREMRVSEKPENAVNSNSMGSVCSNAGVSPVFEAARHPPRWPDGQAMAELPRLDLANLACGPPLQLVAADTTPMSCSIATPRPVLPLSFVAASSPDRAAGPCGSGWPAHPDLVYPSGKSTLGDDDTTDYSSESDGEGHSKMWSATDTRLGAGSSEVDLQAKVKNLIDFASCNAPLTPRRANQEAEHFLEQLRWCRFMPHWNAEVIELRRLLASISKEFAQFRAQYNKAGQLTCQALPCGSGLGDSNCEVVKLSFHLACAWTEYGECLRVVGDAPELGSWRPEDGTVLTTSAETYPKWRSSEVCCFRAPAEAEASSPCITLSYKYVRDRRGLEEGFAWEENVPDRRVTLPLRSVPPGAVWVLWDFAFDSSGGPVSLRLWDPAIEQFIDNAAEVTDKHLIPNLRT